METTNINYISEATNAKSTENPSFVYQFKLWNRNIYKLDRYFLVFQTIEEIKDNIIEILNDKEKQNIELIEINDNELKMILKVMIGRKEKGIEFILTKKQTNKDNLINVLIDKINILEKENQILKNKILEFEDLFKDEIKEKKMIKK